jgi:hypothetical protein
MPKSDNPKPSPGDLGGGLAVNIPPMLKMLGFALVVGAGVGLGLGLVVGFPQDEYCETPGGARFVDAGILPELLVPLGVDPFNMLDTESD